jgi:hypothetical protein
MKGTALAPSQHIRSTLGRARTSRTAFAGVVLLGATLALSACGTQQAGTAAIVDGSAISEQDVQAVAVELAPLAQGQQQISPSIVLGNLILEPYVLAEAGKGAPSDAQVRQAIAKVANPSSLTMNVVRTNLAIQSLSPAAKKSILAKLGKAKVTVNPRYGSFNATQAALVPISPDWIKASASPGAK